MDNKTVPANKSSVRSRDQRRSFATADLSDEEIQAIATARMDERHAHLNSLLDQ